MTATHSDARRTGGRRQRARRPGRRGGFTLVELIIGVMLALVVLLAAGSLFLSTERSFQVGSRKLLAQQEAALLATNLGRRIHNGAGFMIYELPDRGSPADSGNGLALYDGAGLVTGRFEWNAAQQTLVDSTGTRVTSMKLQDVKFRRDPTHPLAVAYRFRVDDERGNFVDIQSAAALRN